MGDEQAVGETTRQCVERDKKILEMWPFMKDVKRLIIEVEPMRPATLYIELRRDTATIPILEILKREGTTVFTRLDNPGGDRKCSVCGVGMETVKDQRTWHCVYPDGKPTWYCDKHLPERFRREIAEGVFTPTAATEDD
jgi:hypothetical protein